MSEVAVADRPAKNMTNKDHTHICRREGSGNRLQPALCTHRYKYRRPLAPKSMTPTYDGHIVHSPE